MSFAVLAAGACMQGLYYYWSLVAHAIHAPMRRGAARNRRNEITRVLRVILSVSRVTVIL